MNKYRLPRQLLEKTQLECRSDLRKRMSMMIAAIMCSIPSGQITGTKDTYSYGKLQLQLQLYVTVDTTSTLGGCPQLTAC